MVGADTIPKPPQSYSHKDLRQCNMKYRVQNEVAAQMNSWRARRLMDPRAQSSDIHIGNDDIFILFALQLDTLRCISIKKQSYLFKHLRGLREQHAFT